MSRRATTVLALVVAVTSWLAMALVLGYGGMQHAILPTVAQLPELLVGMLVGGVAAFAACWVVATAGHRHPRIGPLPALQSSCWTSERHWVHS